MGRKRRMSRNTEREESFPGRCLAPNCMPESDCISSFPSPYHFHRLYCTLVLPLSHGEYLQAPSSPCPQQYATPETWHKKRYCATPWNFLLRPCRYPPPFSIPPSSLPSATCIRKRRRASILRSGLTFFRYPFNRDANIVEQERKRYTEKKNKSNPRGIVFFLFKLFTFYIRVEITNRSFIFLFLYILQSEYTFRRIIGDRMKISIKKK